MALDLPLTDTATMLRDALQRYLADNSRPGWQGLAQDLGLMGVGIPEESGGTGGGAIERAVVAEALGPAQAGADWLSHHLAASALAQLAPGHALLPSLADGSARIALALDPALVAGGAKADWLLVLDGRGARLVAADEAERRVRAMFDGTETADLTIPATAGENLSGDVDGATAWARNAQLTARCAECAGLMARMLHDTAQYLNSREQFGQPIARFQVLRHRMADMHMALLKAGALIERAVLAEGTPGWDHAVSAAVVETTDAVRIVGEGAVQLHGGMGVTEELDLGGMFKRGLVIASTFGPRTAHLARHAATLG
ncbi:acyl-CoA dehydrogenase family protein [Novosphingobium sp.]|uniref:acyl-CoA dehydrogenase family protein n=1 Tax=Novosphingobium sp. TaxID=1874826 RepID=UPI00286B8320|nr:acyl-CoA dehydrogenase family protein [Novosphingobium sp.]